MIPKSVQRFSEKIMLKQEGAPDMKLIGRLGRRVAVEQDRFPKAEGHR